MQGGDQDTAVQTYDRALELNRRNVDAYVARGAAFANQRDFSRAVADFETAMGELVPSSDWRCCHPESWKGFQMM